MFSITEPRRYAFAVLFVFLASITFADKGVCSTTDDTNAFVTLMELLVGSIGAIVILLSAVMTVIFSLLRKSSGVITAAAIGVTLLAYREYIVAFYECFQKSGSACENSPAGYAIIY